MIPVKELKEKSAQSLMSVPKQSQKTFREEEKWSRCSRQFDGEVRILRFSKNSYLGQQVLLMKKQQLIRW